LSRRPLGRAAIKVSVTRLFRVVLWFVERGIAQRFLAGQLGCENLRGIGNQNHRIQGAEVTRGYGTQSVRAYDGTLLGRCGLANTTWPRRREGGMSEFHFKPRFATRNGRAHHLQQYFLAFKDGRTEKKGPGFVLAGGLTGAQIRAGLDVGYTSSRFRSTLSAGKVRLFFIPS